MTMTKAVILWDANGWMTQNNAPCGRRTNSGGKFPFPRSLSHLSLSSFVMFVIELVSSQATVRSYRPQGHPLVSTVTEPKTEISTNLFYYFALPLYFSSPSATFGAKRHRFPI